MRKALLAWVVLALCACNELGFQGKSGGGTAQGPKNSADAETGKPSDDSEGVPGYLVDPETIEANHDKDSGKSTVKAPAGSVEAANGVPLDDVLAAFWEVVRDDFEAARQKGKGLTMKGKFLGTAPVSAKGEFSFDVPKLADDAVLVITLAKRGQTPKLFVPKAKADRWSGAVWEDTDESGAFAGLGAGNDGSLLDNFNFGLLSGVPFAAQYQIATCLVQLYGANVDVAALGPYRSLRVDGGLLSAGNKLIEDNDAGKPEIVHVTLNTLTVTKLDLRLLSPKATYCLDFHALTYMDSSVSVHCDAKLNDGSATLMRKGVQIKKTGC